MSERTELYAPSVTEALVDRIIEEGLQLEASDIHIEIYQGRMRVRYRMDGRLIEGKETYPIERQVKVIARLKVLAKIDSIERRIAQDGRIYHRRKDGSRVDIRLAVLPLTEGEKAVLRLLPRSHDLLRIGELGFSKQNERLFRRLISGSSGLVLLAGPVNSGKTTTLYAALAEINTTERNIMTIEDPPEYKLEGILQIPVNVKTGMTYARSLRALLRADIDAICLGEIRDAETAEIAVRAALTGHLLFSSVHTADSLGVVSRLLDMGIAPYMIAEVLRGVVAQRLVRRLCTLCGGTGCESCRGTGFRGRIALHEVLYIDEELRTAINERRSLDTLRAMAMQKGLLTLLDDGRQKVAEGYTTMAEVMTSLYGESVQELMT